jgi:glycerol kinase
MDLKTCAWDPDLCNLFEIPIEILPEIRSTTAHFGFVKSKGKEVPISASVVDQQAALMGHACYAAGQIKVTFGTGVFALANVGTAIQSDHESGILSTVAWQFAADKPVYAVDAGVYNAGSAVNWVRSIGLFNNFPEIDQFENPPAASRGLVFVPALSGLACPFWDRTAAGLWLGISLETTKEDLCQAVLEGIALRTSQLLDAIDSLTGSRGRLSVDGGLTHNSYFCQFLADVTQNEIVIPASPDITPYGTGRFALIGSGLIKQLSDLPPAEEPKAIISPHQDITCLKQRFGEAVMRSRNWRQ